jgi:hypothetical protein
MSDRRIPSQAIGYLKYLAGQRDELVYFRGQSKIYNTLSPSLFRQISSQAAQSKRINLLNKAVEEIVTNNKLIRKMPAHAREPLLQHYGFKTSWIDLVDNIWIALWFACYDARTTGKTGQYIHFEQRNPDSDSPQYSHIVVVSVEQSTSSVPSIGYFQGSKTECIDLRIACPSVFLRPHAQHGVLFRMRGAVPMRPNDYSPRITGIIRIDLRDALKWLGDGKMLGTHALFPPPYYDDGYSFLLNCGFIGNPYTGSIQHVGA